MKARKAPPENAAELEHRAFAAYFRACRGASVDQPNGSLSGFEWIGDRGYVVLRGGQGSGILAVYRVRAYDGVLKRLRRAPKEIT